MIAQELLDILVCPADRGPLLLVQRSGGSSALYNPRLHRAYRIDDDIPVLLIDEAVPVGDDEHALLIAQAGPADPQ
ncbi:MAG: Trm112 family protein [Mycobacterium sp.]